MNFDENKYQNLKQILQGSQTQTFPSEQRNLQKEKVKNKVRLIVDDSKDKFDSDDHDLAQFHQDTTAQQDRTRQSEQKSLTKFNIHSSTQRSKLSTNSINHIFDSSDDTVQTIDLQSAKKLKKSPNKYQQFLKNVNNIQKKKKYSDADIYITPVQSATGLVKGKLSTELRQSSQQAQRKLSSSQKLRDGYSIGMLNSTGALNANNKTQSSQNLTETLNFSNQSPIKLVFKDKLKLAPPSKHQISSLRNIPSPLSLKEGINKLISPKESKGERQSNQFFLTCATQRGVKTLGNELTQDLYQTNAGSFLNQHKAEMQQYQKSSMDMTSSQPFFLGHKKNLKAYTTTNTFNNLPFNSYSNLPENNRDEMTENFKTTLNLIDINEMKKFEFKDSPNTTIRQVETKKHEKLVIYKPNISSLDQILKIGRTNLLQLGVNDFTYFCIRVKGEQSPLRVKINQDRILNYKIMVSKEYPQPSQFNCDYNLQGNVFSFESDNNTGYFTTQDYFYFSIYSNDEAIIRLHVSFGTQYETFKNLKEYRELAPNITNSAGQLAGKQEYKLSCFELTNRQLRDEVRCILEKRRRKIGAVGVSQNIIQKNIESLQHQNPHELAAKKKNFLEQKKLKILQAQEQKNQLFENHIYQLTTLKEEKEKIKQEKALKQLIEIKKFQKKTFDLVWLTTIAMVIATKKLAIRLQKHKERQRLMRDMAFSLLRPFFRYKTKARKIGGQNINLRVILESKYVLNSYAQVKKKKVKAEAEKMIVSALIQNGPRYNNVNKILKYIESSKKIVNKFIIFHQRIINFKKLLFRMWEKYFFDIIGEIIDVRVEQAAIKNPSLSKRFIQNVQQSLNHIDHKRTAIQNYFSRIMFNYKQKLRELTKIKRKEPSIYVGAQKSSKTIQDKKEGDQQLCSSTSIQVNLKDLAKEQQNQIVKSSFRINIKEQGEEEQKTNSDQSIDSRQVSKKNIAMKEDEPRLFIIPSREQFKQIIYEATQAICAQYPDLQKKVIFKYKPL